MKISILLLTLLFSYSVLASCETRDWRFVRGKKNNDFVLTSKDAKTAIPIPFEGIEPFVVGKISPKSKDHCVLLYVANSNGTKKIVADIKAIILDLEEHKSLGIVLDEIKSVPSVGSVKKATWKWSANKVEIHEPKQKKKKTISLI